MVSIPPLVCDLRADLARRPTMTELFHRGYNPRTLPPEFTTVAKSARCRQPGLFPALEDGKLFVGRLGGPAVFARL